VITKKKSSRSGVDYFGLTTVKKTSMNNVKNLSLDA